ncbi:MAG: hypothetical protein HYY61_01850 [Deltaproteobacteria bacterium]|nr:hypothetical protein [Deltaproteobacteria bacterium]
METKFFLLVLIGVLWCGAVFPQTKFERLDPHGSKTMNLKKFSLLKQNECQVCHFLKEKKVELKSNIPQRCILCHGKLPHSGVGEHIVKKRVTCLNCHFPHRAALASESRLQDFKELESRSSFLKVQKEEDTLPSGLIEKSNFDSAMLRVTCTGCHSWK